VHRVHRSGQAEANIVSAGNFKAGTGEIYQVGVLPTRVAASTCAWIEPHPVRRRRQMQFHTGPIVELTNDGRVVR
jgi:hypothetical protein